MNSDKQLVMTTIGNTDFCNLGHQFELLISAIRISDIGISE